MIETTITPSEDDQVSRAVLRIQSGVLTLVGAMICGLGLFAMTVWLLIKDGVDVGVHLNLLGNYFVGYSVTWVGSVVGLFYGAMVGGALGWTIGFIYNRLVQIRHR
jgi:hypothetical protein